MLQEGDGDALWEIVKAGITYASIDLQTRIYLPLLNNIARP